MTRATGYAGDDMELFAGMLLGQTARLIRPIAEGGMGTVWLAQHLALGCEVAVKVLRGDKLTAARRGRFAREAKLTARIKSPYVLRIFDYGLCHGQPYIVMERLQGQSLARRIAVEGALAPALVVQLGM
ncbi:MAG TPA: serine/threonine protein kinase, partial [Sorangium sp.]|nr:serine/threonine protein kinase [Sorangium sp.]